MATSVKPKRGVDHLSYHEPPFDSGTPVWFRVHIDHIDNEDRRVWAVHCAKPCAKGNPPEKFEGPYLTAKELFIDVTFLHGCPVRPATCSPRAYLVAFGRVVQRNGELIRVKA